MSSSEDEDCYGNIAERLKTLKNNYRPDKPTTVVNNITKVSVINVDDQQCTISTEDSIINLLEDVPEVPDPPPIETSKKRPTRRSTRKSAPKSTPQDPEKQTTSKRGRKRKNNTTTTNLDSSASCSSPVVETVNQSDEPADKRWSSGRRGRGRGKRVERGRGRRRNMRRELLETFVSGIIYSVGNTMEYPDTAEDVPIFSKNSEAAEVNEVKSIDLSSSFAEEDENEEISVKVCWQQTEYVKFNIRKFQKLTQVFEFFSKRESVPIDKLLFTLKGKILRLDDTPDSIQYNIAQFIDGGVVKSSIATLATGSDKENASTTGILIKFQCQNSKKPFHTRIEPDQKLSTAMLKCAEHLELPYSRLRFVLDGDAVSGTSTPREHGLESGDCIDVKIAS